MAEKNANDPWLFNFREAWLRMLAFDFEGSVRVCESILRMKTRYPVGQPQTIARIATGYAAIAKGLNEFDRSQCERAIESFREVQDPQKTPKFFVHWMWRMIAQLGMSQAWLQAKNIEQASVEADGFLRSALEAADPHLQALAWEMQIRIAMFKKELALAEAYLHKALEILQHFDVPVAAWQVHAAAWELYRCKKDYADAKEHRRRAEAYIIKIANSFASDEPLRESFLSALPVVRILKNPEKGQAADLGAD